MAPGADCRLPQQGADRADRADHPPYPTLRDRAHARAPERAARQPRSSRRSGSARAARSAPRLRRAQKESSDRQAAHHGVVEGARKGGGSPMKLPAVLAIAVLTLSSAATAQNDGSLVGMWGYHIDVPVGLNGTLTIQRRGAHWRAHISGADAASDGAAGDIRIVFPNEG